MEVHSEIGSDSYTNWRYSIWNDEKEVAENMDKVIRLPGGAYNFGSETSKSMYEITKEFLSVIGKNISVEDANPRHNLWMNCEKASSFGVTFSSVENGLKKCAKDYGILK